MPIDYLINRLKSSAWLHTSELNMHANVWLGAWQVADGCHKIKYLELILTVRV